MAKKADIETDPVLNLSDVARQLGKHRATIARWVADGLIECVRMPSGLHGIKQSVINRLLAGSAINKRVEAIATK